MKQELLTFSENVDLSSLQPWIFECEIRITESLVYCVVISQQLFIFLSFSFDHCIICPLTALLYLQTFLNGANVAIQGRIQDFKLGVGRT